MSDASSVSYPTVSFRIRRHLACGALLVMLATAVSEPARAVEAHVPGEVIVGFEPGTPQVVQEATAHRLRCSVAESAPRLETILFRFDTTRHALGVAEEWAQEPAVRFAHPNYLGAGGFVPDDTWFSNQWHLDNTGQFGGTPDADVDATEAWDIATGSSDIVVAVLDTGIDSDHTEFAGRFLPGHDFVNEDADPEADHLHGAVVTGLLAANADNAFSVTGIDHGCTVLPVKVLDQFNAGTTFDLIQGIDYSVTEGAHVISMSLINYPGTGGLIAALQDARAAGSILLACGGNNGIGNADVSWPGASPETIAIGWTDNRDRRSSASGTGTALDLVAPGLGVRTIVFDSATDGASIFSGCSAATPVAAGVVSVMLSVDPTLTQDEVLAHLIAGAEDQVGPASEDTPGWDPFFGWGRINMRNSLGLVATGVPEAEGSTAGLTRAWPNPFQERTEVRLTVASEKPVDVSILDAAGREVRSYPSLVPGRNADGAFEIRVHWNGRGEGGTVQAAGIYFVKVRGDSTAPTAKLIRLNR